MRLFSGGARRLRKHVRTHRRDAGGDGIPVPAPLALSLCARGRATDPRTTPMSDTPPDRLATDPRSPHHDAAVLERGIGIRFNGVERHNVEEYCVSEGWVRLPVGKSLDRRGQPMTMKVNGTVEPYFLDIAGQD